MNRRESMGPSQSELEGEFTTEQEEAIKEFNELKRMSPDASDFITELAIKLKHEGGSFETWLDTNRDKLEKIANGEIVEFDVKSGDVIEQKMSKLSPETVKVILKWLVKIGKIAEIILKVWDAIFPPDNKESSATNVKPEPEIK